MEGSQIHRIKIRTAVVSEYRPVCLVLESVEKNLRDVKILLVRGVEVKAHTALMATYTLRGTHPSAFYVFIGSWRLSPYL